MKSMNEIHRFYSVGENRQDDGGARENELDLNFELIWPKTKDKLPK